MTDAIFKIPTAKLDARCWWWRATITLRPRSLDEGVYDGDTVWAMIDRGWDDHSRRSVRLSGIDAPEVRGAERPEGLVSKDRLLELLPVGRKVHLYTRKDQGKYGRYIADVYVELEAGVSTLINRMMVEEELAEEVDY